MPECVLVDYPATEAELSDIVLVKISPNFSSCFYSQTSTLHKFMHSHCLSSHVFRREVLIKVTTLFCQYLLVMNG